MNDKEESQIDDMITPLRSCSRVVISPNETEVLVEFEVHQLGHPFASFIFPIAMYEDACDYLSNNALPGTEIHFDGGLRAS